MYLPSCGKYFSRSFSSRINKPPVAQLIVVSCVPTATRMVSARAGAKAVTARKKAASGRVRVREGSRAGSVGLGRGGSSTAPNPEIASVSRSSRGAGRVADALTAGSFVGALKRRQVFLGEQLISFVEEVVRLPAPISDQKNFYLQISFAREATYLAAARFRIALKELVPIMVGTMVFPGAGHRGRLPKVAFHVVGTARASGTSPAGAPHRQRAVPE